MTDYKPRTKTYVNRFGKPMVLAEYATGKNPYAGELNEHVLFPGESITLELYPGMRRGWRNAK